MSAQVESSFSLFESASHVLDQADLIELVSGATLRNSPPSRMVTSSPILTTTSQSLTRPSSPSLESAFNILGDQDHIVSQITLINGEKIWVREEKGPSWTNSLGSSHGSSTTSSNDDCNSSTDSINICVPLLVSTSNQVAELDLSSDMMDLSSLFNSTGSTISIPSQGSSHNCETVQVLSKPAAQVLVKNHPAATAAEHNSGGSISPMTKRTSLDTDTVVSTAQTFGIQLSKPGNSLLRSALTGKTSYLMTKQQNQQQSKQRLPSATAQLLHSNQTVSTVTLPTFRPGSESSKIGEQKVEEILLLAKKRTLENSSTSCSSASTSSSSSSSHLFATSSVAVTSLSLSSPVQVQTNSSTSSAGPGNSIFSTTGDKLVINTANLLNTAASQLNLAPPSLSTLLPVQRTSPKGVASSINSGQASSGGDSNNNVKSITGSTAPTNVISLVVDVGNNNVNNTSNLNLVHPGPNLMQTEDSENQLGLQTMSKKRILKRQKSTSQAMSNCQPALISSAFLTQGAIDAQSGGGGSSGSPDNRKEARLLHYCPICNKGFKDRYSVNVHVRTHTGEKPFSCALCGKCFRQKAHLAKHHQTHAAKQSPGGGGSIGAILQATTQNLKNGSNSAETKQTLTPQAIQTTAVPPVVKSQLAGHQALQPASSVSNKEEKIIFPLSPVSLELSS